MLFHRGKGRGRVVGRVSYQQKIHWNKLGVQRTVSFYWLNCDSLLLAGLFPAKEKTFLPPVGVKVVPACKVPLLLLVLQLIKVIRHESFPLWPLNYISKVSLY